MDHFELDVVPVQIADHASTSLEIRINGQRLEALARVVEMPHAAAEGKPKLAGDYLPLSLSDISAAPDHFLGHPVASWFEDGDAVLLGCPCGEWGCWPLTAHIDADASTVQWHNFRNGHRDWNLQALGPFKFDRHQYDEALQVVAEWADHNV